MKRSFIWLIMLFILLTTYKPQFTFIQNFKLNIKEIIVVNNSIINSLEIKQKLNFLYDKNLLSINTKNIEHNLKSISFIESFSMKKIYPNKLKLTILEKKPIAIIQNRKDKKYISDKGELINYKEIEIYNNLPLVFGNGKSFYTLYKKLHEINFPVDSIKSFYFFESGRWDLTLIDDKIIKLPVKNFLLSLKNFMKSKNNSKFDNYKIFDYRIKNQLILN